VTGTDTTPGKFRIYHPDSDPCQTRNPERRGNIPCHRRNGPGSDRNPAHGVPTLSGETLPSQAETARTAQKHPENRHIKSKTMTDGNAPAKCRTASQRPRTDRFSE
jgi:hypothetical protein